MTNPDRTSHDFARRRWLARIPRALLAVTTGALAASLAPASINATTGPNDGSILERRIEAVRQAAHAAAAKPDKPNALQTAQWRNWPNWPNWRNYWPNWGNW